MFSRIVSTAIVLGGLVAGPAFGQVFFGLDHAAVGDADLVMTPSGLSINNLGHTGKDGVDVRLPPPAASTHRQGWYGHVQGLRQPVLDSAFVLACVGAGTSGVPEQVCSMRFEYLSGIPTVSFDYSGLQPATVRVVYYSHGTILAEEVLPAPVAGPFALTGTPVALDPLYNNGFSAHFVFSSHCWVFDWTWDTSRMTMLGGGELLGCDHVEVYAEAPLTEFDTFTDVSMRIEGPPSVNVTHELAEVELADCPCDFALPFGQLDFSDVIGFLQCFASGCP